MIFIDFPQFSSDLIVLGMMLWPNRLLSRPVTDGRDARAVAGVARHHPRTLGTPQTPEERTPDASVNETLAKSAVTL